tara:strand:- start:714 stop:935 length:222 start_codon:yes stop_codon:yes gene_type:complete
MNYKVTYPVDYLDSKPTVKTFDNFYELEEWIAEEVQHRIDYTVQHSPYTISEKEYEEIEEYEYSLIHIEDLNK